MAAKVEINYIRTVISRQLDQLRKHEKKARQPPFKESVHQLRVYSRRLDASLEVFKKFFPKKKVKAWHAHLRELLKNLGDLRDLEVLIAFLKKHNAKQSLSTLLNTFEKKMQSLQQGSLSSIEMFRKTNTSAQITDELDHIPKNRTRNLDKKLAKLSCWSILKHLEDVNDFRKFVNQPARADKLHQLRLALKQLRYVMEVFDRSYEGELKEFIDHCAKLQTHLGDMHDHEIWLEDKTLGKLKQHIASLKKKSYKRFRRCWQQGEKRKNWHRLEKLVKA